MQTNLQRQKADQRLPVKEGGAKGAWGDEYAYVYGLDYGEGFTDRCIRQNLSKSIV